jgi:hypothetical protein
MQIMLCLSMCSLLEYTKSYKMVTNANLNDTGLAIFFTSIT